MKLAYGWVFDMVNNLRYAAKEAWAEVEDAWDRMHDCWGDEE